MEASITENEKVAKEDINLFKPIEFSNSFSPNGDSNESINLWNKLPDKIVETILLKHYWKLQQRNSRLPFHNANMF